MSSIIDFAGTLLWPSRTLFEALRRGSLAIGAQRLEVPFSEHVIQDASVQLVRHVPPMLEDNVDASGTRLFDAAVDRD